MKHKIFLMALIAVVFIACEQSNEVNKPISVDQDKTTTTIKAHVDFSYETKAPYSVIITDKSSGKLIWYQWGDGSQYNTCNPGGTLTHKYKGAGTYKIKCTATGTDGSKDDYTVSVTISDPKIYIAGIKYNKVEVDGEYYKAVLKDDDFFTTTWINTGYTKVLNNSRLPYSYIFTDPVYMSGLSDDKYYTLYIYRNTKQSGNGTQCLETPISTTVFQKCPETIAVRNSSGKTQVELLMEYK